MSGISSRKLIHWTCLLYCPRIGWEMNMQLEQFTNMSWTAFWIHFSACWVKMDTFTLKVWYFTSLQVESICYICDRFLDSSCPASCDVSPLKSNSLEDCCVISTSQTRRVANVAYMDPWVLGVDSYWRRMYCSHI